jgi:hypothetical protein
MKDITSIDSWKELQAKIEIDNNKFNEDFISSFKKKFKNRLQELEINKMKDKTQHLDIEDFDKYLKSKLSEKQYNSLHDKTFIDTEDKGFMIKAQLELPVAIQNLLDEKEREKHSKNKILHGLNVRYINLETDEVTNITEEILNYDEE